MPTNLLDEAQRIGGHRTKKATVAAALQEYIQRRQVKILELFGTVEYDPQYYYKKQRRTRRGSGARASSPRRAGRPPST